MSRIIAGAAGGLRLTSVPGDATRPTTDRVKESIFSKLDAWGMLRDARVLDLYAGSGALGCEAASRGAARVELVDNAPKACAAATANAQLVNQVLGTGTVTVRRKNVTTYMTRHTGPWDVVLADPPYPLSELEVMEFLACLPGQLGKGAVIVLERSARSPEPVWPTGIRLLESSRHGETMVWYAEEDLS